MDYLIEHFGLLPGWLLGSMAIFMRYLIFAGTAFLIFYVLFQRRYFGIKIQQISPKTKHIANELSHSIATAFIWGTVGLGIYWLRKNGFTHIYLNLSEYGLAYLFFSFWFLVFLHDTYFYWMHRFAHLPRVYPLVHKVHHLSTNPSALSAFAFHPLEALLEALGFMLIIAFVPMTLPTLAGFGFFAFAFNVMGHLGYELLPRRFLASSVGRWFNSATGHNVHHRKFRVNYGLYTLVWDRLFGTIDPKFDQSIAGRD
jgi:sterol desaturase/sphingolipid hydroxylase (fatty acid hydroxylase superfamily)